MMQAKTFSTLTEYRRWSGNCPNSGGASKIERLGDKDSLKDFLTAAWVGIGTLTTCGLLIDGLRTFPDLGDRSLFFRTN